jgi:hypothetical protein
MSSFAFNPLTGKLSLSRKFPQEQNDLVIVLKFEQGKILWKQQNLEEWSLLCNLQESVNQYSKTCIEEFLKRNLNEIYEHLTVNTATVDSFSGDYNDLRNLPFLGSAAFCNIPQFKDSDCNEVVLGSDSRLTDPREWIAKTASENEAETGNTTERRAWSPELIWKAISAWWNQSSYKTKLDEISTAATCNQADSFLLNRSNHTGVQSVDSITGLSKVAITGSYGHLREKPELGDAASLNVGTTQNTVAAGDDVRFSDLDDRTNNILIDYRQMRTEVDALQLILSEINRSLAMMQITISLLAEQKTNL